MSDIERMKTILSEGKNVIQQDNNILKYAMESPIGNSIYINALESKIDDSKVIKKRAHWNDTVECKICGKNFTRSARSNHCKTQYHLLHEKMNDKLKNILLN